jgi:hypothetical protein
MLILSEVTLAYVPVTGAGLLIHSYVRLSSVDPGTRPDHLITFRLSLPERTIRSHPTRNSSMYGCLIGSGRYPACRPPEREAAFLPTRSHSRTNIHSKRGLSRRASRPRCPRRGGNTGVLPRSRASDPQGP